MSCNFYFDLLTSTPYHLSGWELFWNIRPSSHLLQYKGPRAVRTFYSLFFWHFYLNQPNSYNKLKYHIFWHRHFFPEDFSTICFLVLFRNSFMGDSVIVSLALVISEYYCSASYSWFDYFLPTAATYLTCCLLTCLEFLIFEPWETKFALCLTFRISYLFMEHQFSLEIEKSVVLVYFFFILFIFIRGLELKK